MKRYVFAPAFRCGKTNVAEKPKSIKITSYMIEEKATPAANFRGFNLISPAVSDGTCSKPGVNLPSVTAVIGFTSTRFLKASTAL